MIESERRRRQAAWEALLAYGWPTNMAQSLSRELGIYGGAQGIWVDLRNTKLLTSDGHGVAVGLFHKGERYPDDLQATGITYHFPNTGRPRSRALGEVEATKNAWRFSIPVFVIAVVLRQHRL